MPVGAKLRTYSKGMGRGVAMVEPGQEAFVESNGLFERVIVIEEIDPPHHPYLTSFPFVWRKVAIQRSPQLPIEVISLRDLRFA